MKAFWMAVLLAMPATAQISHAPSPVVAALQANRLSAVTLPARPHSGKGLNRLSVGALVAANEADSASSWRAHEANPFLAEGCSQFGVTSIAIKSGFVATSLAVQHLVLRHRPDTYRKMAWLNFVSLGAFGGVAAHNFRVR